MAERRCLPGARDVRCWRTFRTCREVRVESAFGARPDLTRWGDSLSPRTVPELRDRHPIPSRILRCEPTLPLQGRGKKGVAIHAESFKQRHRSPYRWRFGPIVVTLIRRSCVARQEPYIPGALSILQGTVPGRVRGSGHMVPTYFRRELRDRALQRPSRLRTFVCLFCRLPSFCRTSVQHFSSSTPQLLDDHHRLWNTGSPRSSRAMTAECITACQLRRQTNRRPFCAPRRWQAA